VDVTPEAVRAGRAKVLARAFGVSFGAAQIAQCETREDTAKMLCAAVGAVPGPPGLRRGALGAVREALREVARADREAVEETTEIAPMLPRFTRGRRWRALAKELHCRLPLLRWTWPQVAVTGPLVAAHAAFLVGYPPHHYVEEPTMVRLVFLAFLGAAAIAAAGVLLELPERMTTVEKLVTWLVANRPLSYRGGTEWTTGQVEEAADAVHRLRFLRQGCASLLGPQLFAPLLLVGLIVTSIWLCVDGLTSKVVVGQLPPGLR
jgi:hypothetical protein